MSGHRLEMTSIINELSANDNTFDAHDSSADRDKLESDESADKILTAVKGMEMSNSDLCCQLRYLTTFEVLKVSSSQNINCVAFFTVYQIAICKDRASKYVSVMLGRKSNVSNIYL